MQGWLRALLLLPFFLTLAVPRASGDDKTPAETASGGRAVQLEIQGAIGPVAADYLRRGFAVAVDLRTVVLAVPSQDVISRDNVSVRVSAVIYFRVIDADRSVIQVEDFMAATSQLAQTTLRSVLGKHDLDEMLAERDKLNRDIQSILDSQTDAWGIKVANVEIKHVDIDESMVRAIARQAEAERNRRARIIDAEGEQQAAQNLVEAANMLAQTPEAMQLRYLSTLQNIAVDRNSTIVFPLPIELLRLLRSSDDGTKAGGWVASHG